jgi:hypothetical protein
MGNWPAKKKGKFFDHLWGGGGGGGVSVCPVVGLFGLASFVAEQRPKEIGIRKVFGASVFVNLWQLLSKDLAAAGSFFLGSPPCDKKLCLSPIACTICKLAQQFSS